MKHRLLFAVVLVALSASPGFITFAVGAATASALIQGKVAPVHYLAVKTRKEHLAVPAAMERHTLQTRSGQSYTGQSYIGMTIAAVHIRNNDAEGFTLNIRSRHAGKLRHTLSHGARTSNLAVAYRISLLSSDRLDSVNRWQHKTLSLATAQDLHFMHRDRATERHRYIINIHPDFQSDAVSGSRGARFW